MLRSARASAVLAFLALQACASMHPSVRYQAMLPAGELHILEHGEIIAECGTTHAFAWEQCAERRAPAGNDLEVVWWHLGEVVARAHVTVDEARVLGFVGLYEGSFGAVERTVAAPAAIRLAPLQPETDLFVDPTPGAHSSVSRVSLEIHNAGDVTITSDGNGYGGELAGDWFVCEAGG